MSISIPTVIGPCNSLIIDTSGSSGNGGRYWIAKKLTVNSREGVIVSALNRYLSQHDMFAIVPEAISLQHFQLNINYEFTVLLCNF